MKLKRSFLPIFLFFLITLHSVSAQICFNGYFQLNSTYDLNRRVLLSSLASNVTTHNGFYSSSMGENSNRIFIIGMCIPGTEPDKCSVCIKGIAGHMLSSCSNETVGYDWIDFCMVRYSNISFSGSLIMERSGVASNSEDVGVDLIVFDRVWDELMLRTITAASNGTSSFAHKYYAAEVASLTTFQTIYAMMQCTPDVSSGDCEYCLKKTVSDYKSCCRGNKGGAYVRPFCFIRWDLYPFAGAFDKKMLPPAPSQSLPLPPLSLAPPISDQEITTIKDRKSVSAGTIVAIVFPTIVMLVLLVIGFTLPTTTSVQYSFKTIEAATDKFSDGNLIGQGGFGEVYKGRLPNGTEVAVKRLSKTSGQGAQEFKNEAVLVTKLQHRNLVRVLGFCLYGEEKILVYELVPNKSLDYFLFDSEKKGKLDWTRRYNIIGGIARGVLYLHQDSRLRIIHRDLKASNILLDADMNPKIADFGTARIFGVDQSQDETKRICGTHGYMSPEYAMHGHFSMKSDVYSFGILALEIISGKKNSSRYDIDGFAGNLVTHAWRLWKDEFPLKIVDPIIGESSEAIRCIHIALLCVQEDPTDRPLLPAIIVMLSSNTTTLPVPRAPGYCLSTRQELNP
ncbi:hypothetical protein Bca101_026701 [Brassica carinata]